MEMQRRQFLRVSSWGLAGLALGNVGGLPGFLLPGDAEAHTPLVRLKGPVRLSMEEALHQMVDSIKVYSWAFNAVGTVGLRIPGPALFALEGDTIRLEVTNHFPAGHTAQHAFAVPGVFQSDPIPLGATASLSFPAPPPGTYLYLDPINQPVNRAMGLHGALVVLPKAGNTPYAAPTAAVQALFDDLGTPGWRPGQGSAHFPGHPWDPTRTWIWVFGNVDPASHNAVQANPTLAGDAFTAAYRPEYFTINGISGLFSSHGHDIAPAGNAGQPALIRNLEAGMATASPHIHGNHVYLLSQKNAFGTPRGGLVPFTEEDDLPPVGGVLDNLLWVDTWAMRPGDVKDVLLPFIVPPDIPRTRGVHVVQSALPLSERQARGGNETPWPPIEEPFPLLYPMHCHLELSQTAAGGNYPQGLVTHWSLNGDVDMVILQDVLGEARRQVVGYSPGINGVIQIDRAEIRQKFGRVRLEGAFSGPRGTVLDVFAGATLAGQRLGSATVGPTGLWSFSGRALAALASQAVSIKARPPHPAQRLGVALRMV